MRMNLAINVGELTTFEAIAATLRMLAERFEQSAVRDIKVAIGHGETIEGPAGGTAGHYIVTER